MTRFDLMVDPEGESPIVDPANVDLATLAAVRVKLPELQPHAYIPDSWEGMGDCNVCGHTFDAPIHIRYKPQRIAPATPEFLLLKEIRWKIGDIANREQDAAVHELWAEALSYIDSLIDIRLSRWG